MIVPQELPKVTSPPKLGLKSNNQGTSRREVIKDCSQLFTSWSFTEFLTHDPQLFFVSCFKPSNHNWRTRLRPRLAFAFQFQPATKLKAKKREKEAKKKKKKKELHAFPLMVRLSKAWYLSRDPLIIILDGSTEWIHREVIGWVNE